MGGHDYHEWKHLPEEPDAGAVYEADFPYVAWDAPCEPPHPHHEKLVSWHYVDNSYSVPSIAAIKQAIYDHGPVAAAVCVNPAFRDYSDGVFQGPECTDVNHAIVLVGWDDVEGAWILRNSWGPSWGESGYMRIEYGVSNAGYAANYVISEPDCRALTTSVSPSGTGSIIADPLPDCGSNEYSPGREVELAASANPGWHFTNWSGDALGSNYTATVTLESDKSVTAHFMCDGCALRSSWPLIMKDY